MKSFILIITILLNTFSYGCYQKSIVSPEQAERPKNRQPSDQQPLRQQRDIVDVRVVKDGTNIHYTSKYCTECHEQLPRNGNKFLKYEEDYKQLCRCHYQTAVRDVHPSDIEPPKDFKKRIPDDFPLQNGKLTCITCHDIFAQCRDSQTDEPFTKGRNFLRGAPYKKLTTLCFRCHDKTKFEKYNPHEQLDTNGDIIALKCLYCHETVPDVTKEKFTDVTLIGDLEPLCVRCHDKADDQTLHARHLRRPSPKVLARIKQIEIEFGMILPLNDNGKITCATCHNPHEKGVIPADKEGAVGAGMKHRHRLSGNMCTKCHEM